MGYPILHSMQDYFRLMLEEVVVVIVSLEITEVDQEEGEEVDLQIYPILASLQEWTGHHVIRDEKIIIITVTMHHYFLST